MDEYAGQWITTYTGKKFHYTNPTIGEICIEDIAHALSNMCRFTGHCSKFYSVAEHSLLVALCVPRKLKLSALLHDAAEAYIGDIARPVKYTHKLDETEKKIVEVLKKKFNITPELPEIKEADNKVLATEAKQLMANMDGWAELPEPLFLQIEALEPKKIEKVFLDSFYYYESLV